MGESHIDTLLENKSLKSEFTAMDLDLSEVFMEDPDDLERENRILRDLLDWAQAYRETPDRKQMEKNGFDFPPIDPDIDPDSDWLRFERWMQGKTVRQKLQDILPIDFFLIKSEELSDDEIEEKLDALYEILGKANFSIDYHEGVPNRLQYINLLEVMQDEFELLDGGFWVLDGCTGWCPGCFQRPWCEPGVNSCWPEDEQQGEIALHDSVKAYVCASRVSINILKERQEKEDREFEEFKQKMEEEPYQIDTIDWDRTSDWDDDDDLPF